MTKLSFALAIAAITAGSTHAADVLYSSEDFEAGTPNYTIAGTEPPYALTQLQAGDPLAGISSTTALAGTDYTPGSSSRSGVFANDDIPETIIGEPTGQHGFVSNSQNRSLILTDPMSLATDNVENNVEVLTISFDTLLNRFDDGGVTEFNDCAAVFYSALGDFTDSVMIATYATTDMEEPVLYPLEPESILGHTTVVEGTWSTLNLSLSSADVTFTDTAKIRFNKLPSTGTSLMIFYDNITITGGPAPDPVPTGTYMATISPAVNPDTGYDIQWPSQSGATYTLFTSPDLDTPIASWTQVEADIAATPPENTYNVPADGARRFYAVEEVTP